MVSSRDVYWPQLFSALCFLRCRLVHLVARMLESTFDTALRALFSNSECFKQRPSGRLISSTNFCSPDDCALNATTRANMQNSIDKFSVACNKFGRTISMKMTDVMHQPAPGKPYVVPNITTKGQRLKVVEKFTYHGNNLLSIVMDDEVNTSLAKVSAAFDRLNRNVWNQRGISETIKIKMYWAVLLYGCKMWTTNQWHIKKLNHFHTTCPRKILSITWQKHISDTEVLTRSFFPGIYTILMQSQLRWIGRLVNMKDHRLLRKLLNSELSQGKGSQGG